MYCLHIDCKSKVVSNVYIFFTFARVCKYRVNTAFTSYNTIQYNTIQYNTIQYNTIQYNTIQYSTVQYNTIQYNTIQYNTLLILPEGDAR